MRRMHPARMAMAATWLVAIGLGFAALTGSPDSQTTTTTTVAPTGAIGWTMGRASAVAFWNPYSAAATGTLSPVTTFVIPVGPSIPGLPTTTTIISGYLSVLTVRDIIDNYFEPIDVDRAIRLCWCLSSFNSRSFDPISGDAGLFKIPVDRWEELTRQVRLVGAEIFDPVASVKVAAWLVYEDELSWANWVCAN